jgi:hemerythrin
VSLLNELADALRNGQKHAAIFREIVRYADFHFATEERLMLTCRYDGAVAHQDMHRRLMDDVRSLRLDEAEGVSVSLTLRYLQEWLLRHIDGADRDLAAALLAAGA